MLDAMRRLAVLLLLALFAAPAFVVTSTADARVEKKKPQKKKKKKKKGKKPAPEPEVKKPPDEGRVLGLARAAGFRAPRAIAWEETAQGRPPAVVIDAQTKEGRRAVVVATKKGAVGVLATDLAALPATARVEANVAPFLDTGLVEVQLTVERGVDHEETLHVILRAGATPEVACEFVGRLQPTRGDGAGRARWVRTRRVHGLETLAFELESEEWSGGAHQRGRARWEIPSSGMCAPAPMPEREDPPPEGKVDLIHLKVVKGELERKAVERVIRARAMPRLERCYVDALRDTPSLSESIAVKLGLDKKGAVTELKIVPDGWPCVTRALRALYFPVKQEPEEDEDEEGQGQDEEAAPAPEAKKKQKEKPPYELELSFTLSPR
jgi:hypothetical protein